MEKTGLKFRMCRNGSKQVRQTLRSNRLGAAVTWLRNLKMNRVMEHSQILGRQLIHGLETIPGIHIIGISAPLEKESDW